MSCPYIYIPSNYHGHRYFDPIKYFLLIIQCGILPFLCAYPWEMRIVSIVDAKEIYSILSGYRILERGGGGPANC